MLEGVLNTIAAALDCGDFSAVREFSQEDFEKSSKPVICVGLKSCELRSPGCGDYLGIEDVNGEQRELFGYRVALCVGLEIFSADASAIPGAIDGLGDALNVLPSGVKKKTICAGETRWDGGAEAFRCPCELSCEAFLLRSGDTEKGEFTDFYLKGVFNKHEC